MKNRLISMKMLMMGALTMVFSMSCTDLEEQVFSQIKAEDFLQSDEEFLSAVGSAYGSLTNFIGEPWSLAEVSSDEVVVPTRGADWFDNGNWQRIHLHQVEPGDDRVSNSWPVLFSGVNASNQLLAQFEQSTSESATAFIAELKGLRALYYYFLLDLYGNVPIARSFADEGVTNNTNFQTGRTEVYNFLRDELASSLTDLTEGRGNPPYGRVNYWTIRALQAKLFLNARVYKGLATDDAADLTAALTAVDDIIDNGPYRLEDDYFANFASLNDGSAENIYVIVYDNVFAGGMNLAQRTLHYQSQQTFNLAEQPWNGYSSLADFYNKFIDPAVNPGPLGPGVNLDGEVVNDGIVQDVRRESFIVGPQFESDGVTPIEDAAPDSEFDPDGPEVVFTPQYNEFEPNACRQCGARIGKYEFQSLNQNQNNDYPIFRLGDILLMKAEILARQNGYGDAEALALVNQIRARAGVDAFTTLTEQRLLDERAREVAFEYWRRNDLIRFPGVNGGTTRFNDPWEFKAVSDANKNVFPIPAAQINAANLNQNPGY